MKSRLLNTLRKIEERPFHCYRRDLWLIVIGGFLFKLLFLWMNTGPVGRYMPTTKLGVFDLDSQQYYDPAVTLYRSLSFHSFDRTSGYPAFLALLYFFTRDSDPTSQLNLSTLFIVQSALITLGSIPLADSVRRLTGIRSLALLIAFLWAFHNSARFFAHWMLTEALSATLICGLAYALVRALCEGEPGRNHKTLSRPLHEGGVKALTERRFSLFWFGMAGIVMFILSLVRPSCSLLALPVGAGVLYTHLFLYRRRRQGLALAMLLLVLPLSSQEIWALRNSILEGQWYFCRLSTFGVYAYGFAIPINMSLGEGYVEAHHQVWNEYYNSLDWMSPQGMDEMYRLRMKSDLRQYPGVVIAHYLGSVPMLFVPTLPIIPIGITPRLADWSRLPWDWNGINRFLLLNSLFELGTTGWILGILRAGLFSRRRWPSPAEQGFFVTAFLAFLYGYVSRKWVE